MDINNIKEMLPDYIRGLLSEEDSSAVKKQLDESEALRREYESLRSYYQAIDSLKQAKAPDTFLDKVHDRIDAKTARGGLFQSLFFPLHVKLPLEFAGVALTIVLLVLVYNPFNPKNIPPVTFDETGITAKKPKPSESTVTPAQTVQDQATLGIEEDKRARETEQTVPLVASKTKKPASELKKRLAAPVKQDTEAKTKRMYASKEALAAGADQNEDVVRTERSSAPAAPKAGLYSAESESGAAEEVVVDEAVAYADNLIAQKDTIVNYKKQPRPEPSDIGILTLAVAMQPVKRHTEETVRQVEEKKMPAPVEKSSSKRKQRSEAQAAPVASMEEIQPGPENEVIFGQIQSIITSHKGKFSQSEEKRQTADTRHYIIKIAAENIPALKTALEKQGVIRDNELTLDTVKPGLVRFELIVTLE